MITKNCIYCGKEFTTQQCYVKRGGGKFCSHSCAKSYHNLKNNPAKLPEVKFKISQNHADVSGKNNPMYGKSGELSPGFIDGRSKYRGRISRKIGLAHLEHKCELCGETELDKLHIHHINGIHSDNRVDNLCVLCSTCHLKIAHIYIRDADGKFTGSKINSKFKERKGGDAPCHYQNAM